MSNDGFKNNGYKNDAFSNDEQTEVSEFRTTYSSVSTEIYEPNDNSINSFNQLSSINLDEKKVKSDHLNEVNLPRSLNAKEYILILVLGFTIFSCFSGYSVLSPILPRIAEQKGLSIAKYSYIFAIYEVVGFFLPPFCSKMAIRMTPKIFLITSMFSFSICSTIFGFLNYAKGENTFFILCLVVRVFWAASGASAKTAIYLCVTILFPNHVSTVFSVVEIAAGAGFMIGPFLAGTLFEIGGYSLPFIVNSVLCLLSIVPVYLLVHNDVKPKSKEENNKPTTFLQLFSIPGVTVNLLLSTITCLSFGFTNSSLDHYLREIDPTFTPSQVGRVFLVAGLIYSVLTYLFGYIAEKWTKSYHLIFLGLALLIGSTIFLGPIYGLPLNPHLFYVIVSQCLFGAGMACVVILSFDDGFKEAKKYLPNNESTMAGMSSLFTSSYAFGAASGPFLSGLTVDRYGFRQATLLILALILTLTIITIIYVFKLKKPANDKNACNIKAIA